MSRRDSTVDMDAKYSSGDSVAMKPKIQEENNNDIDELSKELQMGCIVDAVKKPNICVETCVYESDDEVKTESYNPESYNPESYNPEQEEDAYSDEFEEDSGEEQVSFKSEPKAKKTLSREPSQSFVKISKSNSSVSTNKPNSVSGRSTNYGSLSVPQTRRINMSFTNERLREIERHNHILLTKILSARNNRKSSIPGRELPRKPVPSAAVLRKNQQRQIDHDNMILLKKIQRAKSSACSIRR
ncbi:uncharacterized protein LOC115439927 [Manduca sexta]|uniref:uncharacterized protein LOC115439927 n=1 Tax=Manduca sexta TaxID=7130 RepID=UPI0018905744|nr:uncharacterized protein LOC115439927 [Manduca sexta]